MLLKSKDDLAPQLAQIAELLRLSLTVRQRSALERERALLLAGSRAERDAAFEIDFRLKDHKNWVVIHDLRLEYKDRVAQIDHLILHPNWDFYVIETKGIHTKLKIENGQWSFLQNNHWRGMANPIEQNSRHIQVLKEILRDFNWLPRTMGIPVVPRFINVVVVPPECLIRQKNELTWVLHMDELVTKARWDIGSSSLVLNIIHTHSGDDAKMLGEKLVALHHPFQINYRERFGVHAARGKEPVRTAETVDHYCEACKKPISNAEVRYCRIKKDRFSGRTLCRACQSSAASNERHARSEASCCAKCGKAVSARVVEFCQTNPNKFSGLVLCRICQVNTSHRIVETV